MVAAHAKRWLYLIHRWLGIAVALVMLAWFLSGMVMLYVGYPKLTTAERLAALPPLPREGCCAPLAQAVAAAHAYRSTLPTPATRSRHADAQTWRLTSVAARPRLIVGGEGLQPVAVDAVSGRVVEHVSRDEARAAAGHFARGAPVRWLAEVNEDAWTHSRALDGHRPLHLVAVDDAQGRWLYVSSRTGEVVRDASASERRWGWVGAWLHWLYVARGGVLDPWWSEIVIALALAGSATALSGVVIGLWRWRFRGTYRNGRRTPYAGRAARWHHVAGLVGGLLACTWVLSGLLSMNPWRLFDAPGPKPDLAAYAGTAADPARAPDPTRVLQQLAAQGAAAREIVWHRVGGHSLAQAMGEGTPRLFAHASAQALAAVPAALWQGAANRLLPGAAIVQQEWLSDYDRWYYARQAHTMTGSRERPLPAVRLRLADPNQTWVVIDPRSGTIVQISDRHQRVGRWLFAFLHSFDLPALLALRPGWDLWMLGFSLAGTVLSGTAVVTAARRLRRPRQHNSGRGATARPPLLNPGPAMAKTQGETPS